MADLTSELIVPVEAIDEFLRIRGATWNQLERGQIDATLEEIQAYILHTDPVVWCEANLIERKRGGGFWRFFEYQKPSLRYRGPVVHEDGAEVGKTREIVALTIWGSVMRPGDILIGGYQDSNLDDIWEEIEFQRGANPWLDAQILKSPQKPHRKIIWRNGNIVKFRPGGHDGAAFRGVHVDQFGFFDEGAKAGEVAFSEFFRALEPECEARLYSVPDGRRNSPFFRYCKNAITYDPGLGRGGLTGGKFVRFHWPKTLMPPPFWDEKRLRQAIEFYGGRDSPGFIRNVLGLWGDPEDTVFPWTQFSPCLRYLEGYTCVKVLAEPVTNSIFVTAYQLNPGYQVLGSGEVADDESPAAMPTREIWNQRYNDGNFDLEPVLRQLLQPLPDHAHSVGGVDVGRSIAEPTEIGLSELRGNHRRWIARVQLKNYSYPDQRRALNVVDDIFHPDHGWGLDAGGVGRVLDEELRAAEGGHRWDGHLTGFVPHSKIEVVDPESGEPTIDPATKRPRKVALKELSTQILQTQMQKGNLVIPWDPDYQSDFPSHTCRTSDAGNRTFSQKNDHVIDEKRMEELRLLEVASGVGSAPLELGLLPNARRESISNFEGLW